MVHNPISNRVSHVLTRSTYADFAQSLRASNCPLCPSLCQTRTNIVVDRGNPDAKVIVVGEAPGETEDLQGQSFVGRSGRLFDRVMADLGVDTNKDMLILNVVKCRPPKNRQPTPQEAANCRPYLEWQLSHVKPAVVLLLGATAAKYFLPPSERSDMKSRVGKFFDVAAYPSTRFFLLYHPAFILRNPRQYSTMVDLARPVADLIKSRSREEATV